MDWSYTEMKIYSNEALLQEFLRLAEKHGFNEMKLKAREDFLHLFGCVKATLEDEKRIKIRILDKPKYEGL
jgi:hypothetical protein